MAIGEKINNQFVTFTDSYTGAHLTRLTAPEHVSHHMYFYNRMTTKDGQKLLYCTEHERERQLFLMDLKTGDAVQLTEGGELQDYGGIISADDKFVFYMQAQKIWRLNLTTLEREAVYSIEEGWSGNSWGMSDDNRYLAIVEMLESSLTALPKNDNWNQFASTCLAKPRCRIVYCDLETGSFHTVVEDNCWFNHVQLRPGDPDTILFCHEGPYDLIDARLWLVQSDGSNYRCCREQPNDLILTHEFWLPDGSKLAFVYQETTGDRTENIRMIDPDTMEEEILMPCSPFAHFICDRKNRYIVGDSQGNDVPIHLLNKEKQEKTSGEVKNDFIYLIDVEKRQEKRLCYHGTSWLAIYGDSQDSHPHPCFTEDNEHIIFVSDREGKPCIYLIDVPDTQK